MVKGFVGSVSFATQAITVDNIIDGLAQTLLPILTENLHLCDAQHNAELISIFSPQTMFPTGGALVKPTSVKIHSSTLAAFRMARGLPANSTKAFTGPTQAEVCQLMLDANQNVGYFNATG